MSYYCWHCHDVGFLRGKCRAREPGKIGLWNNSITMGGNMPDVSKLPPEAAVQMKAMGMPVGSNTIRVQHCMTAQEVASDALPTNSSRNQSCTASNVVHTGKTMSADMKCTGDFQGTWSYRNYLRLRRALRGRSENEWRREWAPNDARSKDGRYLGSGYAPQGRLLADLDLHD
jgi:Protein of unknown function (DUF3617)